MFSCGQEGHMVEGEGKQLVFGVQKWETEKDSEDLASHVKGLGFIS